MQRKPLVIGAVVLLAAASLYESRYSSDMQEHIRQVNSDLEDVSRESIYATGLAGSIETMTDEAKVAGEIFDTHDHVHTVRDELLARKVKQATEAGITVGGAIQSVINQWPNSI